MYVTVDPQEGSTDLTPWLKTLELANLPLVDG